MPSAALLASQDEIIERLGIDRELLKRRATTKGGSDLRLIFQSYEASLTAIKKWASITKEEWPNKPATQTAITDIWLKHSQYGKWEKTFKPIKTSHPELLKWLQNTSDHKEIEEFWDTKKNKFTFNALNKWIEGQTKGQTKKKAKKSEGTQ
jgi:hypothetical protein